MLCCENYIQYGCIIMVIQRYLSYLCDERTDVTVTCHQFLYQSPTSDAVQSEYLPHMGNVNNERYYFNFSVVFNFCNEVRW